MNTFTILRKSSVGKNDMDQDIIDWVKHAELNGYMDMLTGNEPVNSNSFIEESTHILLSKDIQIDVTNRDRIKTNKDDEYEITFVDDPVDLGHHYEIYLKKVS